MERFIKGEDFPITSVSRQDLLSVGWTDEQIKTIPDWKMERLAEKMACAYLENGYWIDLKILAEDVLVNE